MSNCKFMEEKANQLSERFLAYAAEIVKITTLLRKTATGREIAGANYEESRGAQSRADFIHKLQIVLKELRESLFWLRLTDKSQLLKEQNLSAIMSETKQLSNIIAKSVITAKQRKQI